METTVGKYSGPWRQFPVREIDELIKKGVLDLKCPICGRKVVLERFKSDSGQFYSASNFFENKAVGIFKILHKKCKKQFISLRCMKK